MRSKLAMFIILCGWFILIVFTLHEYLHHGFLSLRQFLIPEDTIDLIFRIIILSAPIGSTITGYLINERKRLLEKALLSERELKYAAHEWRATFDSMPYGVVLTDSDFNVIRANKYIESIAGIPVRELSFNKKCYKILHRGDFPLDCCPLRRSLKSRDTEVGDYFYDNKLNKYFLESVTPFFNEEGEVIAYIHVLMDVTDVRENERRLTESKDAFFNMLKDLDTTYKELKSIYNNLVIAFSKVIDAKSHWTKGHSERVTNYAIAIAREMGLDEDDIEILRTAGLLHDIGKIGTYDVILDKPDNLTEEEFALVKIHPIKGIEILSPIKGLEVILPVIRSHHERIDGRGYPDALRGDEIPLLARILCIADAYDSMTSNRPYRPAPGNHYAIAELIRCSGTQFDPYLVDVFLTLLKKEGKFLTTQRV
jgi:putative nucleotidyltransferase with HDIG domain